MGIAAYGVYEGVYYLLPVNVAALIPSLLIAFFVYFATLMALGGVDEADLRRLPKGHLLAGIGRKCYLLRDPAHTKALEEQKRRAASGERKASDRKRPAKKRRPAGKKQTEKRTVREEMPSAHMPKKRPGGGTRGAAGKKKRKPT